MLQTDGYAAYRRLADPKRAGGLVRLAFCWSHWRRQWFDLAKSPPPPIATEALQRIAELGSSGGAWNDQGISSEMRLMG